MFRSLISETIPNHRDYPKFFELKGEYKKVHIGHRSTFNYFHMRLEGGLMNQFLGSLSCRS